MPYYLLTVESSHRTDFGLQVKPTVRIKELASRWLDDTAPTGGHPTKGWRQIIEDVTSAPWWQADPDTVDPPVPDR